MKWTSSEVVRHKAHEAEGTKLAGIAEAMVGRTITRKTVQVTLGEGQERDEILRRIFPPPFSGML
jgi:hypothetical protein